MSSIYGIPLETCAHADGRKGCTSATLAYSPTVGGISCTKCGAYAGHGEALVCRWETISFAISQIGGLVERFEEDNRILAKKLEAAELLAATATQELSNITGELDFEPDDMHTIADMANVGKSLMERLPKGYFYNSTPAEIVTDLINERDEAIQDTATATQRAEAMEADARRYRWLRDMDTMPHKIAIALDAGTYGYPENSVVTPEQCDVCIDKAMSAALSPAAESGE